MDSSLVIDVLNDALEGCDKPEIFNTDQGSQYTSKEHTQLLMDHGIQISMDGKGQDTLDCTKNSAAVIMERAIRSRVSTE